MQVWLGGIGRGPSSEGRRQEVTLGLRVPALADIYRKLYEPSQVIPGTVMPSTGVVKNANSVCLNGQPFQRDLDLRLARTVRLMNDANCFALNSPLIQLFGLGTFFNSTSNSKQISTTRCWFSAFGC